MAVGAFAADSLSTTGIKPTRREFLIGAGGLLVLAPEAYDGEVFGGYDNFSEIAPTVPVTFPDSDEWRRYVAKIAEAIAPVVEGREVATLRIEPEAMLAYGPNTFTGTVLAGTRVSRPEPPEGVKETFGYYEVSPELLPKVDGDIIFVYGTEPGAVEEVTANPLWDELPAVQNGLAFEVDFEHWLRGVGYSGQRHPRRPGEVPGRAWRLICSKARAQTESRPGGVR